MNKKYMKPIISMIGVGLVSCISISGTVDAAAQATSPTKIAVAREKAVTNVEPSIRVLLGARTGPFSVSSPDSIVVLKSSQQKWKTFSANAPLLIQAKGAMMAVNGVPVDRAILVQSNLGREKGTIRALGKTYRGAIKVTAVNGAMSIVNEVPLEQYLYGVVPSEAVPSWPMPALEAQAVAARTYALYNMETNKMKAYDVKPTTYNQVYNGAANEYSSTTKAVDNTKGMVMTYGGKPINALFHSDGGGYTENSENVWGSYVPYLRGVKDFARNTSTSQWMVTTTRLGIQQKLESAGKGVGTLKSIVLSSLGKRPLHVMDRGVSGRVKSATFIGSTGQRTVSGEALMDIFNLKSTLFDFYVGKAPIGDIDGQSGKSIHTFGSGNQPVYIKGQGWGHGLGLSQWGAAAMAAKAGLQDRQYYQTILNHYYSGIKLQRLY